MKSPVPVPSKKVSGGSESLWLFADVPEKRVDSELSYHRIITSNQRVVAS